MYMCIVVTTLNRCTCTTEIEYTMYMYMYYMYDNACAIHMYVRVHVHDCLGCAVLLCLVCLFDLACFFLSSFSSLI